MYMLSVAKILAIIGHRSFLSEFQIKLAYATERSKDEKAIIHKDEYMLRQLHSTSKKNVL